MPTDQHELIIKLLRENQELVRQNNELLIRQERRERRRFIFKVIWYTILLGIPLLAYYYLYSMFAGLTGAETRRTPNQRHQCPAWGNRRPLRDVYGAVGREGSVTLAI
jgi:hypothetical protein